jgi:hypothetical protein
MTESPVQIGPAPENVTQSSGECWRPSEFRQEVDIDALRKRIEQLTPANDDLLEFAKKHHPSDQWWQQTDDPFTP